MEIIRIEMECNFTYQNLVDAIKKLEDSTYNPNRFDVLFQVYGIPLRLQLEWFYEGHGFKYFVDTKGNVYDTHRRTYKSILEAKANQ